MTRRLLSVLAIAFISLQLPAQTLPSLFNLSGGDYTFTQWSASEPAGTYPANMRFHYTQDPTSNSYDITANGTGDWSCAYNLGSRNRFEGQGANGFSMIATSSPQYNNCSGGTASLTNYVGAAVLGLNTTNCTNIGVKWTGRTLANSDGNRVFIILLQYRVGNSGSWINVSGSSYTSSTTGTSADVEEVILPAAAENKPVVYLRWVYKQSSGDNGTRPNLGVDEITVRKDAVVAANNLSITADDTYNNRIKAPNVSGVYNDANDPASNTGLKFLLKDNGVDVAASNTAYSVTATSSNTAVVPASNITLQRNDGNAIVKINPSSTAGYSTITLSLSKSGVSTSYSINYAGSVSANPNFRWGTSIADASTAQAISCADIVVVDDEANALYVYPKSSSGLPIQTFNLNANNILNLTDGAPNYKEMDLEASVKSPTNANKMYLAGSMSNSSSFNNKPNRNRIVAVTFSGTSAPYTFANAGYKSDLRAAVISWGDAHGYNFSASAADGKDPKQVDGFNLEGMAFAPDNTTMYLGFRAPLVPTGNRTKAVIAPLLNFEAYFAGTAAPTFGAPIELNLNSRGIREIIRKADNTYLIVAGIATDGPANSSLYSWTGNAADAPVLLNNVNLNGLNPEGLYQEGEYCGGLLANNDITIISDNGTTVFYNDGVEAKSLAQPNFKKFAMYTVSSALLPLTFTSFNAQASYRNGVLNWEIANASNVKEFEVFGAGPDRQYLSLGRVPFYFPQTKYGFRENAVKENLRYYYVQSIDFDGHRSTTPVRMVQFDNDRPEFVLYPNPASDFISWNGDDHLAATISDAKGVKVLEVKQGVKTMNISHLANGAYTLILKFADGSSATKQFLKQ